MNYTRSTIYEEERKGNISLFGETQRPGAYHDKRNKDMYQIRKLHQQGFYIREIRVHISWYFFLLSSRVRLGLLSAQGININPRLLYQDINQSKYKSITFFGSGHPLGVGVE